MAAPTISLPPVSALPPSVQRYAATGAPPSTFWRDLVTASNQIPRWGYLAIAGVAGWIALRAWQPPPKS